MHCTHSWIGHWTTASVHLADQGQHASVRLTSSLWMLVCSQPAGELKTTVHEASWWRQLHSSTEHDGARSGTHWSAQYYRLPEVAERQASRYKARAYHFATFQNDIIPCEPEIFASMNRLTPQNRYSSGRDCFGSQRKTQTHFKFWTQT